MPTTDDDIRTAFKWPVRYEDESGYIRDSGNHLVLRMYGAYISVHKMIGEAIAAMLNERFAPHEDCSHAYREEKNQHAICANCGRIWLRHYMGDGSCPDDTDGSGWHPTNRFAPKGDSDGQATDKR